ncbi:MAG: hypothetical protein CMP61_04635 [Flavobacteriales bacterium]|nr:hypothetical protein [Flavobacteriales bacterium]|tara:strand:+ start:9492 stop:9812 length:321 start_codon:yes stop_codon:yes gene_type:complete
MKVLSKITVLGAAAFLLASCSITRPLAVTDNSLGEKVGKSKNTCVLGMRAPQAGAGVIISSGICFNKKYGIVEAVENGGIKTVGAVDIKVTNFYLWRTYELIVAGE